MLKPKPRPVPATSAPADSAPADTAEVADASAAPDVSVRQNAAFVVQVMQSAGSILLGDFAAEYVTRPTLIESTSAKDIHSGFAPFMRADLLQGPSVGPRDVSFCALHADSLSANKLCINKVEESLDPCVLVHDAHCMGHQISIVCDETLKQKELDIINGMHATKKLMSNLQPRRDIVHGYERLAKKARIVRCVHPPPGCRAQHEEILKHSVDDGVVNSWFSVVNDEHDEFGKKDAAIGHEFLQMFNGDWSSKQWQHFCVKGENDRRPCCSSIEESRSKLLKSMSAMHNISVFDKLREGTNKWAESPRRCSKTSILVHCHESFPQASSSWTKRKRGENDADTSSDEHAGDDFSLRTRKRKRKACKFWSFPRLACVLSGAAISTKPIRLLLSKCFAAEKEARIRSSLRVPLPKRTLLTEFVCAGGHFDQCVGDIEDLLQTDSPLLKVCSQTQRNMTRNRGMVLKARASVEWRLMQHVKRRTGYFQTVCVVDEGDDVQRQAFWQPSS